METKTLIVMSGTVGPDGVANLKGTDIQDVSDYETTPVTARLTAPSTSRLAEVARSAEIIGAIADGSQPSVWGRVRSVQTDAGSVVVDIERLDYDAELFRMDQVYCKLFQAQMSSEPLHWHRD